MSLGDRKRIEDVRCPAFKGLPGDICHMLHHSFVDILKMRSIENLDVLIDASKRSVLESLYLLKRTWDAGF
jgi:hypothetical protein